MLNKSLHFFKKWANPGLFLVYFQSFQTTIQFLQPINVNKCPSKICRQESNPQPLKLEPSHITTRPEHLLHLVASFSRLKVLIFRNCRCKRSPKCTSTAHKFLTFDSCVLLTTLHCTKIDVNQTLTSA